MGSAKRKKAVGPRFRWSPSTATIPFCAQRESTFPDATPGSVPCGTIIRPPPEAEIDACCWRSERAQNLIHLRLRHQGFVLSMLETAWTATGDACGIRPSGGSSTRREHDPPPGRADRRRRIRDRGAARRGHEVWLGGPRGTVRPGIRSSRSGSPLSTGSRSSRRRRGDYAGRSTATASRRAVRHGGHSLRSGVCVLRGGARAFHVATRPDWATSGCRSRRPG